MKPGFRLWLLPLALALATALPLGLDRHGGLIDARAHAVELFGWMDSDENEESAAAAPADTPEIGPVARFPDFADCLTFNNLIANLNKNLTQMDKNAA